MTDVVVIIGNTDQRLTQAQWASFMNAVTNAVMQEAVQLHGVFWSSPTSDYQTACIAFAVPPVEAFVMGLKYDLSAIAKKYGQDAISWLDGDTEFLTPEEVL